MLKVVQRREIIKVRNSDPPKDRKNIKGGLSEGKTKTVVSLILN